MTDNNNTKKENVQRKIIHADFDAFFASVEVRDNPKLLGYPVAVGGVSRRGVIATCNYEARQFGIHSAMSSAHALKLCPELKIIPPRFSAYKEASFQAKKIFSRYTSLIEPLSLDEAYLDVSGSHHHEGSATRIAEAIRYAVFQELKVTISAGVAPNKFLAKIASDWHKPDGLCVINPDQVDAFVAALPVKKIHGVGKKTAIKLHDRSIYTCGELRTVSKINLNLWFGRFGDQLWNLSRGIDDRPVLTSRRRKSLSVEKTYEQDLQTDESILEKVDALLTDLQVRYQAIESEYKICKHFVKVKFIDFTQTTLEEISFCDARVGRDHFRHLILLARNRKKVAVRLLGLGFRLIDLKIKDKFEQLGLF